MPATQGRITIAAVPATLGRMTTIAMIIRRIIKRMVSVVFRAMVHRVRVISPVVVKMADVLRQGLHAAMGVNQILVNA